MAKTKMELKAFRDKMIVGQYTQGMAVEDLAYIYNISSQRVQEVLRNCGIQSKVDTKRAKEMKSTKVVSNNTYRGW